MVSRSVLFGSNVAPLSLDKSAKALAASLLPLGEVIPIGAMAFALWILLSGGSSLHRGRGGVVEKK